MAGQPKPKLVVFDLDYTLWPFWVDSQTVAHNHTIPFRTCSSTNQTDSVCLFEGSVIPFVISSNGNIEDRHGVKIKHYPEVPTVLAWLKAEGYTIAVASRSSTPEEANILIKMFDWDKFFLYKEIYPGSKLKHFKRFVADSGIPMTDMLFFDDEYRNIQELSHVGVTCVHIDDDIGVTQEVVNTGLQNFAEKHSHKVL